MTYQLLTICWMLGIAELASAEARADDGQTTYKGQAVLEFNFPDPSLIQVDDNWYAFSTSGNGKKVQVASSPSFLKPAWKLLENIDALPDAGAWTEFDDHNIWAPDVIELDNGRFVMYYAATWPDQVNNKTMHCIGAATSNNVIGPYSPATEPIACPLEQGGAIDPAGFLDPVTGNLYVVYKVDGNSLNTGPGACGGPDEEGYYHPTPIMLQQVDNEDGVTRIGSPTQILDRGPYDGPLVEAPNLFYNETFGLYFLTFSSNCYSTDFYDVGFAYSTCLDAVFMKSSYALMTTWNGMITAPGGADMTPDGRYALYHGTVGRDSNGEPVRHMFAMEATVAGLDMFTFPLA